MQMCIGFTCPNTKCVGPTLLHWLSLAYREYPIYVGFRCDQVQGKQFSVVEMCTMSIEVFDFGIRRSLVGRCDTPVVIKRLQITY